MSSDSASSEVTYTSISSHGDPLAWAVDFFRLQEPDSPEAAPAPPDYVPGPEEPEQAPLSPDYVPGPEYPEYLAPSDEEVPIEDQPYAVADSPIALSPGYVADSDPEEDSEDGPVDYLADGGDGDDDDSSDDDEEEKEASKEEEAEEEEEEEASEEEEATEEEEEHLAPANSIVAPVVYHVPSSEETESFETDDSAATPPSPPACRETLALPTPPLHPHHSSISQPHSAEERLASCFSCTPAHPTSPLPRLTSPILSPNQVRAPTPDSELPWVEICRAFITITPLVTAQHYHYPPLPSPLLPPLPSPPLPPLPDSLFIPSKSNRYEVGESSTTVPRPTGGRRVDLDPRESAEEVAPVTLEGVNTRVTELTAVQEQDTQEIYAVIEDTQDRQTQIYQTVETLVDDSRYHYETARLLDQEALVLHSKGHLARLYERSELFKLETGTVSDAPRHRSIPSYFMLKLSSL
ncbi:hypothetical protein Tco_1182057 [Tanacetum coccineum]